MSMTPSQKAELARIITSAQTLNTDIEALKAELQDEFDEKSERWQESEKGEAAQAIIDELENQENAAYELAEALEALLLGD